jgi:TrmH family RNA methyltransferase
MVTSPANPLVKEILAFRRSYRRRRAEGRTLVEGFKILELALHSGAVPDILLYDPRKMTEQDESLVARARELGSTVREVSPSIIAKVSVREGPLGCVASVRIAEAELDDLHLSAIPLIMVMEGLEKPGNLGALVRTASAAGSDALIAADSKADIYSPATVHASLGAVFQLPVVRCSSGSAIKWLQRKRITVISTSPSAAKAYYELDLTRRLAIAIGNEHRGLSEAWLAAGTQALIPMSGPMNSLNATTSGGIVLFEAVRQRSLRKRKVEFQQSLP